MLPTQVSEVAFSIIYRDQPIRIELNSTSLRLALRAGGAEPINVLVEGHPASLSPGQTREFPIGRQH